MITTLPTR